MKSESCLPPSLTSTYYRLTKVHNSDKPEYKNLGKKLKKKKNSQVFQLHGRERSSLKLRYRIRAQVQTFQR